MSRYRLQELKEQVEEALLLYRPQDLSAYADAEQFCVDVIGSLDYSESDLWVILVGNPELLDHLCSESDMTLDVLPCISTLKELGMLVVHDVLLQHALAFCRDRFGTPVPASAFTTC